MAHKYQIELTDTFGGEANYSWVRRASVTVRKGGKLGDHTRAGNAHCRSFPSWPDGVTENDKARGFGTVADIVPAVELAQ